MTPAPKIQKKPHSAKRLPMKFVAAKQNFFDPQIDRCDT